MNTVNTEFSPCFRDTLLLCECRLGSFPIGSMLSFPCAMLLIYINKITDSWGIVSGALLGQHWLPGYCCPEGVCSNDCDPGRADWASLTWQVGAGVGKTDPQRHSRSFIAAYGIVILNNSVWLVCFLCGVWSVCQIQHRCPRFNLIYISFMLFNEWTTMKLGFVLLAIMWEMKPANSSALRDCYEFYVFVFNWNLVPILRRHWNCLYILHLYTIIGIYILITKISFNSTIFKRNPPK